MFSFCDAAKGSERCVRLPMSADGTFGTGMHLGNGPYESEQKFDSIVSPLPENIRAVPACGMSEMEQNSDRARRYRQMAMRIRYIAEDVRGDEWRRLLLKVAADYNRLALHFEATPSSTAADGKPRRRSG